MLTTLPGGLCITNGAGARAEVIGGIGVAGDEGTDEVAIAEVAVKALGGRFGYR